MSGIFFIAEHAGGAVSPVTYELAVFAGELKSGDEDKITVVVIGEVTESRAEEIAERTGVDVICVCTPGNKDYNSEVYIAELERLAKERMPRYICAAHTQVGLDFAPGLAERIGAACITGVSDIRRDDGAVCFTRAAYGGKVLLDIAYATDTTVLTVQPGAFRAGAKAAAAAGGISYIDFEYEPRGIKNTGYKTSGADRSGLTEARTIVAAGRGIGSSENLEVVRRFAELFAKSAVAGSRPLIDTGWLEYARQVGLTGAAVSPELYVACGISGSSQHVAGMKNSKFIVAINSDENAAIFNIADVCVVDDVVPFMEEVIRLAGR